MEWQERFKQICLSKSLNKYWQGVNDGLPGTGEGGGLEPGVRLPQLPAVILVDLPRYNKHSVLEYFNI